jgi:hypothetical protein
MPTFEVMCPNDGKVRVRPDMIWLDLDSDLYCYTCPMCEEGRSGPVSASMVSVLQSHGVDDIDTIVAREIATLQRIG